MDFLPLMVRTLSVDTPLFYTDSLRQAGEILWLTVAVFVILCRLVLRVTTQRQRPLRVLNPFHVLVATKLDRGCTYVPVLGVVDARLPWPMGFGGHESFRKSCVFRVPWVLTGKPYQNIHASLPKSVSCHRALKCHMELPY